jgi:hypothetical protein
MSDQNLIWIKDHWDIIFILFGFVLGLIVLFVAFQSGYNSAIEVQRNTFFIEGMFAYNDIYNTCTYITKDGSFKWDGYCFNQKEIPDFNSEGCITGCKLQARVHEDINDCVSYCKTCFVGDC